MPLWRRKKNWEDDYDESYSDRPQRRTGSGRLRIMPHLVVIGFVSALFLGGVGAVAGTTMFEKTLMELVSPTGLLWIGLTLAIYFSLLLRQSWSAFICLVCWLILTLAGNGFVAKNLMSNLEQPYLNIDPLKLESFDTVVLLGGGTETRINGSVQVNSGGDRLVTAARMFHHGLTRQIICSGSQALRTSKDDLHPREEAFLILQDLGVPKQALQQLSGDNTFEEIKNLAALFETTGTPQRVGILTSAFHLPRAMRLAKSNGLTVEPIPANFLSGRKTAGPDLIIPSAINLGLTQKVVKEHIAGWLGR